MTVLEASDRILPGFGARLAFDAAQALRSAGVRLRLNSPVAAVDANGVRVRDGGFTSAAVVLWAGGVRAAPLLSTLGLPQGAGGRLTVDRYLRSTGHADISIVGDAAVAAEPGSRPLHPPSAQMAIQQGRTVARNVVRARFGKPLVRFVPVLFGEVISLGRWNAVATIGGREIRGPAAALAKRAAAANYVRSLGGTALVDRLGWLSIPRTASGHRPAVVSGQKPNVLEKAGGSMWKSAT